MRSLNVLEYIRHADGIWNLPLEAAERMRREFPGVTFSHPRDRAEADAKLPDANVVLGWAVTRENFASARSLEWIQVTAAGVGAMLFPALIESPVVVTNGRGLHAVAMAEHTLGVILAFVRKLHLARDAQREKRWDDKRLIVEAPAFGELQGSVLGLVGFGAIGSAIAVRARALGMEVIAVRKHPAADPAPADQQWGLERLPELLSRSDWLVLALPLTDETRGMIGAPQLARMKPGAVLINLGRGPLVHETALIEALENHRLAGAGLDVFEREPLPAESPLWSMPNVIVTPHVSGLGPRYWDRAMDLFTTNLRHFLAGEPLTNVVDKRAGY